VDKGVVCGKSRKINSKIFRKGREGYVNNYMNNKDYNDKEVIS